MSRCEDEKMWRWDTDPHYWKNPALRRSREKSAGIPNGVFVSDVARKFWRRTSKHIQKWRCQRKVFVRALELWLTIRTLHWQRGDPNTLNSTKLLFSMDSVSPWAAKIVGNKFCHGSRKLRRNVGKLRRNLGNILVMFPLFFFWNNFEKTEPRFQDIAPILVHIFPQCGPHIPMKIT